MKSTLIIICQYLSVLLLPLTISVSSASTIQNSANNDPDTRSKLLLPADEQHLVLSEMRNFVIAIHNITKGIAKDDMLAVAQAAKRMGSAASGDIPPEVVAKLPSSFKQLARKVHSGFDMIAMDAKEIGDGLHTIEQLSELTSHCIACHAVYRIDSLPK